MGFEKHIRKSCSKTILAYTKVSENTGKIVSKRHQGTLILVL